MKSRFIILITVIILSGKIAPAQDEHYPEDSLTIYYEKCMTDIDKSFTKDNDFFCSCSTYRVVKFFTISEMQNLTTSSPKAYLIGRCEEMANEFGGKPERSPELEQEFIASGGDGEVKLTPEGVYYTTILPGNGPKPLPGQTITIECELGLPSVGVYIFSTIKDGTPLTFEVGQNTMIKGLELGVQMYSKGGEGFIFFPPKLGYGSLDRGEQLPANSDIMCHIKVLDIK